MMMVMEKFMMMLKVTLMFMVIMIVMIRITIMIIMIAIMIPADAKQPREQVSQSLVLRFVVNK